MQLSRQELAALLQVDTVSPTVYNIFKRGRSIVCASQTNRRSGWLPISEESMVWLTSRNYVEVFAAPEEILV